jgi:DNA topoisomerase-1
VTSLPVVIKEGRFGAYVTDGETNATLRKADTVESMTIERGAELLAEKRAAGPSKKRGAKKSAAKKTGAKKTAAKTAKKTAAKKTTKKSAAKKS